MRFGALIALALFVLVPRLAMGLGAPSVVVIPPPPPLGQPPQVPIIDPPANLAAMVGKPIARVTVELPRAFFNVMVSEGARVADWREAFHYGQAKATGVPQLLKLIERVVDLHEERARLRRAKQH